MITFSAVREMLASIVRPEEPHRPVSPGTAWTLAGTLLLALSVLMAVFAMSTTAEAAPAGAVWQAGRTSPYSTGETFRSGALGYTVHGLSTRAGYAVVEIRVHNPNRLDEPFEADWVRIEGKDGHIYRPDVIASLRANDGRPAAAGARLYGGQSTRLLLFFSVPEDAPARRVLISDPVHPGEFAGAALLCLDNNSPSQGDRT